MRGLLVCALSLVAMPASAADTWVVRDEEGNLFYSDVFQPGARKVDTSEPTNIDPHLDFEEQESKYDGFIRHYSMLYRVDPFLVKAVIRTESLFDPNAESEAGAQGLMQLMPGTADRFRVTDALDPEQNIRGGTEYLRWLLDLFGGDSKLAIAAYNCGEHVVQRYKRVPNIPETEDYVVKVERARREYKLKGFGAPGAPRRDGAASP